MAAKRLKTFVHVHETDEDGNVLRTEVFGPDDTLPAWAKKAVGAHVWDDGEDEDLDPLDPRAVEDNEERAKAEAKAAAAAAKAEK